MIGRRGSRPLADVRLARSECPQSALFARSGSVNKSGRKPASEIGHLEVRHYLNFINMLKVLMSPNFRLGLRCHVFVFKLALECERIRNVTIEAIH